MGIDPSVTLHDIRWGEQYTGDGIDAYVWVMEISGAVPASHLTGGYAGATGFRQSPMYFRLGGATLSGVSRPGECVWSRVYVMHRKLHANLVRSTAGERPEAQPHRRPPDPTHD